MSTIAVNNITDEQGSGRPSFTNGVQTSNINGGQVGGRRNRFHNGDMRISQRGTSFTIGADDATFTLDRIQVGTNDLDTTYSATIEQVDDAPEGFINSLKYTVDSAALPDTTTGSNSYIFIVSSLERNDVYDLIFDQSSVVSFWVKSSVRGDFSFVFQAVESDSGLSDDRLSYVSTYTVNNANTWEYKVIPIPKNEDGYDWDFTRSNNIEGARFTWSLAVSDPDRANKNLGWLDPNNESRNVITATGIYTDLIDTQGATFQITGVQYEAGDTATEFEHRSYGEELALCQRYYWKSNIRGLTLGNTIPAGNDEYFCSFLMPSQMRTSPSVSFPDGFFLDLQRGGGVNMTGFSYLGNESLFSIRIFANERTIEATYFVSDSDKTIEADAEL